MFNNDKIINAIKQLSGTSEVMLSTSFSELGMDSTTIVELLIECEVMFDIDVLSSDLNLDEFIFVEDVCKFLQHVIDVNR